MKEPIKKRFKMYLRECKRCRQIYRTSAKEDRICDNCDKKNKTQYRHKGNWRNNQKKTFGEKPLRMPLFEK